MPFGHPLHAVTMSADAAPLSLPETSAAAIDTLARRAVEAGAHRLELLTDLDDLDAADLALACGFAFEGVRRDAGEVHGQRRDLVAFARTATDPGTPIAPAFPPFGSGGLDDGTVGLREATLADLDGVHEQDCDEATVAYGFGEPPRREEAARMLAAAPLQRRVGPSALFAIVDLATGRFGGTVRLRRNGPPGVAMFGYAVHPAFRGRGFTTRALRLLSAWAFAEAGIARLELGARHDNVASQRAALAAGFAPEGVMHARLRTPDGTFRDETRFYLLPG